MPPNAMAPLDEVFGPTLFLYDSFAGGVGFSEKLYGRHHELLANAHTLIASCPCERGCPSCVGPLLHFNERSKELPLRILSSVLGVGSDAPMRKQRHLVAVPQQLYEEGAPPFAHGA